MYYDYDPNHGTSRSRSKHQESAGNSKNNSDGSGKSSNRYNSNYDQESEYEHDQEVNYKQQVVISKTRRPAQNCDQIFTDPNLLQTIKEDLARISSTKNLKLAGSGLKEKNRLLNV